MHPSLVSGKKNQQQPPKFAFFESSAQFSLKTMDGSEQAEESLITRSSTDLPRG